MVYLDYSMPFLNFRSHVLTLSGRYTQLCPTNSWIHGTSVVVVVVGTKIARSRVLGVCVCYKHNQAIDIGEKMVRTRFEFLKKAY